MVGGLLLGLVEEYVVGYTASSYRDAVAFRSSSSSCCSGPRASSAASTAEKV